jgi:hypothetical protein
VDAPSIATVEMKSKIACDAGFENLPKKLLVTGKPRECSAIRLLGWKHEIEREQSCFYHKLVL